MESACSISQAQHVTSARESFGSTVSDKVCPSDHSHLHGASHTTIQAGVRAHSRTKIESVYNSR
jgi:hypothetical protein